jgi:hypothetical protein
VDRLTIIFPQHGTSSGRKTAPPASGFGSRRWDTKRTQIRKKDAGREVTLLGGSTNPKRLPGPG